MLHVSWVRPRVGSFLAARAGEASACSLPGAECGSDNGHNCVEPAWPGMVHIPGVAAIVGAGLARAGAVEPGSHLREWCFPGF